jgi:CrcB protein
MSPVLVLLALGVAGACGALARYGVAEWTARHWQRHFPLATFLINVSGAFALGVLVAAGGRHPFVPAELRTIIGTGLLGGYTTFSTLSFETNALARRGLARHAWANAAGTLVAGVAAAAAGMALGAAL